MNMFYSFTFAWMQFFIFQERIYFLTNPVNLITHKEIPKMSLTSVPSQRNVSMHMHESIFHLDNQNCNFYLKDSSPSM